MSLVGRCHLGLYIFAAVLQESELMVGQHVVSPGPPQNSRHRWLRRKSLQRSQQHHIRTFRIVHPWTMMPLPERATRIQLARLQRRGLWQRILRRTPCSRTRALRLQTRRRQSSTLTRSLHSARMCQYTPSWLGVGSTYQATEHDREEVQVDRGVRETPEEERSERAAYCAEDHD